ncbi:uncharacterized protein [Montipora capricornis]|uniref:uncharacterized protein n=1 Tax=Montipora capricornis TaxID=246305 RepID=UPI0035F12548
MAEYRFRQPKSVEDEERCVLNAIPKSTRYKNKWAARIFEEWGKARFPKVATLEPGGLFKEYDLHKVQSLEIPLLQMDALSVNYWLTKFVQEVAKPSKERYPPKTISIYQIVCGLRRFMEENNEKLDFNPLDASDKRFSIFRRVLDAEMKEGTRLGIACETIIFSYYLLSFVVNKVMFFYLANMQIKKICIRVSGQVDEFRNPMKTELKTRPCLKAVFSTRFSLDF